MYEGVRRSVAIFVTTRSFVLGYIPSFGLHLVVSFRYEWQVLLLEFM